jgi:TAK1-binding protein 1
VGLSTNQIYKEDGYRREGHECEDRSFHFKIDDHTFLYGVFNGKDGPSVADFAAQRMPAEILLGQLNDKTSPEAVKTVLSEAFLAVERSYFESIDDLLAERANLLCELPDGMVFKCITWHLFSKNCYNLTTGIKSYDAYQQFPDIVNRLRAANVRLSASASAAVALIFKG